MLKYGKFCLLLSVILMAGCTRYSIFEKEETVVIAAPVVETAPDYVVPVVLPERSPQGVSRASLRYCPNNRQCAGESLLPPIPCEQPMPQYYKNISEITAGDGVLLIHPYTRTKILCTDDIGSSAVECADFFRAEGYVLITDIPQFAGRYDFLRTGTYPTRRWRNGGENVPRW